MSAAVPEIYPITELASIVAEQGRQIKALTASLQEGNRAGSSSTEDRKLGYRFDAAPKWLCESGWREQSPEYRKAWPLLWRLLELERWPGAPIKATKRQLADHLGVSEDTVKRRLAWLEEQETVEVTPGTGRRPSTVVISHPVATPLAYDEVPWAGGGLLNAPPGYLEDLRGPGRTYAKLYGVELPEPAPVPDRGAEAAPLQDEPPDPVHEATDDLDAAANQHEAAPGGAVCTPSEMREDSPTENLFGSDARAREEAPQRERQTEKQETSVRELEREAKEIPRGEITKDAIADARRICEVLARKDELTAARAAQVAELLRRKRREYLLTEALSRIQSVRRSEEIHRPIPYLCTTLVSIARSSGLTDGELELASDVLTPPDQTERTPEEDLKRVDEEIDALGNQPYGWFFGEKVPKGVQDRHDQLKRRKTELEGQLRRRGYGWHFGE